MRRTKRQVNDGIESGTLIKTGADLRKVLATIMTELADPLKAVTTERREQLRLAVKTASHINESFGIDLRAAHLLIEAKKANLMLSDITNAPIGSMLLSGKKD